ncbi:MAG TPA: phosphopantetheine-binding protein [Kofleriaceae bacterium]|nr:phosphopantetheine-binding protein [Kofleriaceae bacterium]
MKAIIGKFSERRDAVAAADASTPIKELGVSSLNFIEMVVRFEETFNVSIPDDEFQKIATIGDAVTAILAAQAGSAQAVAQ